jgi:histidyl-tRNA synthetase
MALKPFCDREFPVYQAPRGTQDVLPEDEKYWRYVEGTATRLAELFGYAQIRIPTFEHTSLFVRGVGDTTDIVGKEMYTFEDKGGESLTLRPEATASIMRAYLEHGLASTPQPVKVHFLGSMFRYDRPQAGRYREFHQFDCEVIGEASPTVDAEVILLAWRFFEALGLRDLTVHLNSIGDRNCRPAYLSLLKEHFSQHQDRLCPDCRRRLDTNPLRLLDCKNEQCQPAIATAPAGIEHLCDECASHFADLRKLLDALDIPVQLNPRLVRGLDYYTRTVFEIFPAIEGAQSALGGGGRYDGLMEQLGGKPTPGIGFAMGIERIILNLREQGIPVPEIRRAVVYVAHQGDEARVAAMRLTDRIRRAGIECVVGLGNRSLKSQLKQANTLGARFAFIIGEQEVAEGTVTVRDLSESQQWQEPAQVAVERLLSAQR